MIALRTNKTAKTICPHGVVFIDDDSVVTSELADNFYYVRGKFDAGCKEMGHRRSRYTLRGIEQEPKEPDPALLLAQAEMEKRRTEMTKAIADKAQEDKKLRMDDDFRRDQLNVQSILKAAELEGKFLIDVNEQELEAMNIANEANQPEAE